MTAWQLVLLMAVPNLICLGLMASDKERARKRRRRISERTLIISAACFGSLGGMAGMLLFRHKTLHAKFAVGLPLLLGVHVVLAVYLARLVL